MKWTEERRQIVRTMWLEGATARQVAEAVGSSAGAIMRVVYEFELPRRGSGWNGVRAAASKERKMQVTSKKGSRKGKAGAINLNIKKRLERERDAMGKQVADLKILRGTAWEPLEGVAPMLLVDMPRHGVCRWPLRLNGEHACCGAGVELADTYCTVHREMSIRRIAA